ncbi:MAG: immune inhibitor A [Anaerolineaceae bacterium]|nr:immune inhibitor A [Anaerolineaceae bacterium]
MRYCPWTTNAAGRVSWYVATALLALWLLAGGAAAQDDTQAQYPTLTALEQAVIPPLDRIYLAQQFRGAGEIPPPPQTAQPRIVGDTQPFQVINAASNQVYEVVATLRVVSPHLYIWVDDRAAVDDADMAGLAAVFESEIYEPVRKLWGSEPTPGIDGDPHLYALFAYGMGGGVGAYYSSNNAYPAAVVPDSNEHEMFIFNLDSLGTADLNNRYIHSIIAHEFQHMIRDHVQSNEDYWLNEGFSTFTQLYLYGEANVAAHFLVAAGTQLNTWAEESYLRPAHYGAALLFTTYLYERFGLEALRELSADPDRGLIAVDNVLRRRGTDVNTLFADWTLANYLRDATLAGGQYGYDLLPPGLPGMTPLGTVTTYPFAQAGTVNQYAADYYVFNNLPDTALLDIRLDAPSTVALLPTAPYSGEAMWYSNRADFSETTLTRAFDLRNVQSATLRYQTWYHLESDWDYAYLMVSADSGVTWEILPTGHTATEDQDGGAYGPGYTGESGGWVTEDVALDGYAGHEILVRFAVITDDAITRPGLALDDVQIPEIGYFDDFETADTGWQPAGWVRIDNRLPQYTWVQAVQRVGQKVTVTRWLATGGGRWSLPLNASADQVIIVIAPFAPQTTVPMSYTLQVAPGE